MISHAPKRAMRKRHAGISLAAMVCLGCFTAPARADLFQVDATHAAAGEVVNFADAGLTGVQTFSVTGISESLALDPTDETAFALGIAFANGSEPQPVTVSQVPITIDPAARAVPLPLWALIAASLGFILRGLTQGRPMRSRRAGW